MTPIRVSFLFLAEDMGLEPTGLLHLTAFPMRLLSHSVNPPSTIIIYHKLRKIASSFCYVFKTFFCSRFLVQNKTFTLRIILYLSLFHRATDCKDLWYRLSGSVLHTKKRRSHICFHKFSADRTRVCPAVSCKSYLPPKNHWNAFCPHWPCLHIFSYFFLFTYWQNGKKHLYSY